MIKSLVVKRSIAIGAPKTSISLEAPFWETLREIAAQEEISIGELVNRIDTDREHANLSSHLRIYVLDHYRRLAEAAPSGKDKRK